MGQALAPKHILQSARDAIELILVLLRIGVFVLRCLVCAVDRVTELIERLFQTLIMIATAIVAVQPRPECLLVLHPCHGLRHRGWCEKPPVVLQVQREQRLWARSWGGHTFSHADSFFFLPRLATVTVGCQARKSSSVKPNARASSVTKLR